jgi:hypothetical protein
MVIRMKRTISIMPLMLAMFFSMLVFCFLNTSNPVYVPRNIVYDMPPPDTTGCTWDGTNWTNPLGQKWDGSNWIP